MANKITTLLEFVGADKASREVKSLAKEFQSAEGFGNKAKVAAKGFGDVLKNNVAEFAAAAGTAVVAFGVKSVQAFQESAIGAGKFSDATGVAVDDASRWIEVADDLGISGENTRNLFVRLNKAIGDNSPIVRELGIEQQKLADGTTDVNATMLVAIERLNRIKDPTDRAAAAQKLFGRNYAEVSELIFGSADELKRSLEGVSDAIVIDEDERRKAEDLRAAMDQLADAFREVQLIAGEELAPTISGLSNGLVTLRSGLDRAFGEGGFGKLVGIVQDAVTPLHRVWGLLGDIGDKLGGGDEKSIENASIAGGEAIGRVSSAFSDLVQDARNAVAASIEYSDATSTVESAVADAVEEYERQEQIIRDNNDAMRDAAEAVYDLYDAEKDLADAVADATETLDAVKSGDFDGTMYDVRDSIVAVARAADEQARAQVEANGVNADSIVGQQQWAEAMLATANTLKGPMRDEVLNHISRVTGIPTSIITSFGVQVDPGALDALENLLARLGRIANNPFARVGATGTVGGARIDGPQTDRAAVGSYGTSGPVVVNDGVGAVPEIAEFPDGTKVMTSANSKNYLAAAGTPVQQLVVQVNAGAVVASRAELGRVLASALREAQRQGVSLAFLRDVG